MGMKLVGEAGSWEQLSHGREAWNAAESLYLWTFKVQKSDRVFWRYRGTLVKNPPKFTKNLFYNTARALKPGGRALFVFMHPCFRIPRKTHWGWDGDQKIQFRRIDAYATSIEIPITTHPGKESGEQTVFHHRPLSELLTAMGVSGLAVTSCEELYSHRRSQTSGPFSKAEHRAAEEFPLFMALMALRV